MKIQTAIVAALLFALSTSCEKATLNKSKTMIPQYRDDWKFVEVKPSDSKEIWMFRKNLGVSEIKGLKSLPTLVYFTVQFHAVDATGLPKKEDAKVLYDFEELVIPNIEKEAECILVASVVKGGVKDHLFYVSDPDLFMQAMNGQRKTLENLKVSFETHNDPKWEVYDDFPDGD
jgi:hypothetical protein